MVEVVGTESANRRPTKGTILVVEDDLGIATLERRRFRRAGYETIRAASCEEAFRKVGEDDVDLVLLDQGLPDGTGLEFYERLKARGYELPVIMVTGLGDEATAIEALRAGVRDFVTKSPEYLDYLPEAVERVLEQVRVEERLKESEEKYRSIFENAAEGIYQASLDGRLLIANPAMARIFGYGSSQEMISAISDTTMQLWASPEERWGYVRRLREEGAVVGAEARMMRKDGSTIWVSANVRALRNAEGEVVALEGTLEDITERKRAEKALREQTDTLEKLNRIGRLLSSELDAHKLVQEVTDRATELTGAEFGAFFYNVTDDSGERYTLYTTSGVPQEASSKFPMPRNTEVFSPAFRGEGVVCFDDVRKSECYGKNPLYHGTPEGHLPVASYLAVPVVSRSGAVLGGLFFGHPEEGVFGQREEDIAVGLAAQAAVAMDNARLLRFGAQERGAVPHDRGHRQRGGVVARRGLEDDLRKPAHGRDAGVHAAGGDARQAPVRLHGRRGSRGSPALPGAT
jgi:PAS domain S-box-containing protein